MEIKYELTGLEDEKTVIEFFGPKCLLDNISKKNYTPAEKFKISQNRLWLKFDTQRFKTDRDGEEKKQYFFLNMKPHIGVVGLRIRTLQKVNNTHAVVRFYIVQSQRWLNRIDCFRLRSYNGVIRTEDIFQIPINASPERLEEIGLVCRVDQYVNEYDNITIFSLS